MSELAVLKKQAGKLYRKAQSFGDLDCGRHMAEIIRPSIGSARQEFNEVWSKIQVLDPNAPSNPFEETL